MLTAVSKHTDLPWVLLYVKRWLEAPLQREDGTLVQRDRGTPQGSAISPLLANLFLHYAFDRWMAREYRNILFERYADDGVIHCVSKRQAEQVLTALGQRLALVGLELHPDKTRIVYCKDSHRHGSHEHQRFDFLGYTFRPRLATGKRGTFVSFSPAISDHAAKEIRREMRRWRLHVRSASTLDDLAGEVNPIVRGWISYYGRFYRSMLARSLNHIDEYLVRWAMRKYKKLRYSRRKAVAWLASVRRRAPQLFAHWALLAQPSAG
jgi:group II intron reverse transcriptase/maturase